MSSDSDQFKDMEDSTRTVESNVSFANLLELASNDEINEFNQTITRISTAIFELGSWYGEQTSDYKRMLMDNRTPLMIAATFGSINVVKFILSLSQTDVNSFCGPDKTTALHCAASSGSPNAVYVIKMLLNSGADVELVDANDRRAFDVILVTSNQPELKIQLEKLLHKRDDSVLTCVWSNDKEETPHDVLMMFDFKIHPCLITQTHIRNECKFYHPGEPARRRDPREFDYSFLKCNDFKKGFCRLGDRCEFAHGIFERGLHPLNYKTELCNEKICTRMVCFFAHTPEEIRSLHLLRSSSALSPPRESPAAATSAANAAATSAADATAMPTLADRPSSSETSSSDSHQRIINRLEMKQHF